MVIIKNKYTIPVIEIPSGEIHYMNNTEVFELVHILKFSVEKKYWYFYHKDKRKILNTIKEMRWNLSNIT